MRDQFKAFLESRRDGSEGFPASDVLSLAVKVAPMVLRGASLRFRLAACDGVPLVGTGVRLREKSRITMGAGVVIEDYAEIQGASRRGITIGANVSIGAMSMIRPSGYYGRTLGEGLRIGNSSSIGAYSYLGCSGYIEIGERVMIGPGVRFFAENHNFSDRSVDMKSQGVVRKSIVVADDVWLASGCTLTAGVTIGRGAVVAAGSVVTKDVPPFAVVGGTPARVLKLRDDQGPPTAHPGPWST